MSEKKFTITNNSKFPLVIDSFIFNNKSGTQHIADLSNFGGSSTYRGTEFFPLTQTLSVNQSKSFTVEYKATEVGVKISTIAIVFRAENQSQIAGTITKTITNTLVVTSETPTAVEFVPGILTELLTTIIQDTDNIILTGVDFLVRIKFNTNYESIANTVAQYNAIQLGEFGNISWTLGNATIANSSIDGNDPGNITSITYPLELINDNEHRQVFNITIPGSYYIDAVLNGSRTLPDTPLIAPRINFSVDLLPPELIVPPITLSSSANYAWIGSSVTFNATGIFTNLYNESNILWDTIMEGFTVEYKGQHFSDGVGEDLLPLDSVGGTLTISKTINSDYRMISAKSFGIGLKYSLTAPDYFVKSLTNVQILRISHDSSFENDTFENTSINKGQTITFYMTGADPNTSFYWTIYNQDNQLAGGLFTDEMASSSSSFKISGIKTFAKTLKSSGISGSFYVALSTAAGTAPIMARTVLFNIN